MHLARSRRLLAACLVAAAIGGSCTGGLALAGSESASHAAAEPGPTGTGDGEVASTAAAPLPGGTAGIPAPAPDPASVPGAEQFGISADDDFCRAAPKVASAFVGLFDAAYARQGPELKAQIESALVAIDVLRSVAPDPVRADLDRSRMFLSRFAEVLADSQWSLADAAERHRDFFAGPDPAEGFAAMTAATGAISTACGISP